VIGCAKLSDIQVQLAPATSYLDLWEILVPPSVFFAVLLLSSLRQRERHQRAALIDSILELMSMYSCYSNPKESIGGCAQTASVKRQKR